MSHITNRPSNRPRTAGAEPERPRSLGGLTHIEFLTYSNTLMNMCQLGDRPEFLVTHSCDPPDKVKFRKTLHLWPLVMRLRADYTAASRSFNFGCSCKERMFGGHVSLNVPSQDIEYKKRIPLGGGAHLNMLAACSYGGLASGRTDCMNPRIGFQYEIGNTAFWAPVGFDLRPRLRLSRAVHLEVCSNLKLPMPRAQYSLDRTSSTLAFSDQPVAFHIAQANIIFEL